LRDGYDIQSAIEGATNSQRQSEAIIITRSNRRAGLFNGQIRSRIKLHEGEIATGDLLMVVKNNYYFGADYGIELLANGDMAKVVRLHGSHELYGMQFVRATLRFVDYGADIEVLLLQDSLLCETPQQLQALQQKLFESVQEDYADIRNKRERYKKIRQDEHYNALLVRMAYAVTCHKSQGGQWKHVYIDMGPLEKADIDVNFMRWLYTAVTRATQKVFLIQFKDEFF
jgi:exodeoxyribonuclease-5